MRPGALLALGLAAAPSGPVAVAAEPTAETITPQPQERFVHTFTFSVKGMRLVNGAL